MPLDFRLSAPYRPPPSVPPRFPLTLAAPPAPTPSFLHGAHAIPPRNMMVAPVPAPRWHMVESKTPVVVVPSLVPPARVHPPRSTQPTFRPWRFGPSVMFPIIITEPLVNGAILEVDWDGDGDFDGFYERVEADCLVVQCVRGRDYASQLTGRATAGQLTATLLNTDGKYSSFNATSPLFGQVLPGRKVRLRINSPFSTVLWTGYLDRIEPQGSGSQLTATLYASGPFIKLSGPNAKVSPTAQADVRTGDVIGAVLDVVGWPASGRTIEDGVVEIKRWFAEEGEALALMQEMEDTEQGFLYEGTDWDVRYEGRYYRTTQRLVSEATFSDDPAAANTYLVEVAQSDPLREIFNRFEATVQPYEVQSASVLWTLSGEVPVLAAGESRTYIATVSQLDGADVAYCESWNTPVVGTDITQTGVSNSDIAVSVSKTARTMFITITNNHGSAAATLTLVQAQGVPVLRLNPFKIIEQDTASQAKYGVRNYPLASQWYFNSAYAEGAGEYLIDRFAEPRPIISMSIPTGVSDAMMDAVLRRTLSSRIALEADDLLTKLGINREFHIETISHHLEAGGLLESSFMLSPADADPGWFILDESTLDGSDVLAY